MSRNRCPITMLVIVVYSVKLKSIEVHHSKFKICNTNVIIVVTKCVTKMKKPTYSNLTLIY